MKKALPYFILLNLIGLLAYADIIPDPIAVKGIVPARLVHIRMVSEVVTVDLYRDSSFVECVFNMRNLDKAQDLEVGFPIMNFYSWNSNTPLARISNPKVKNQFEVYVKEHEVSKVDVFIPQSLTTMLSNPDNQETYRLLRDYQNQNRPWYLWKVHFGQNETLKIIVKYRLPAGAVKSNRFFNYLLSTGAGWEGTIGNAQVIVNLKDIPKDQLLNITPDQHLQRNGQQLIWNFKNLEPTTQDDIFIRYENDKGAYKAYMANMKAKEPAFYVDEHLVNQTQISDVPPKNIAGIHIDKNNAAEPNGTVRIYTCAYALVKFQNKIKPLNRPAWRALNRETVSSLSGHYSLAVNGRQVNDKDVFKELLNADTSKIIRVNIEHNKTGKRKLIVDTR